MSEEVLNMIFENKKENELKKALKRFIEEYGVEKTYLFLSTNNQILLNSCNIDENEFNQILFKNYMLSPEGLDNINMERLSEQEKTSVNMFKATMRCNNFDSAFYIFSNKRIVYQLLCMLYVNDLAKNEKVDNKRFNNEGVIQRIVYLKSKDLSFHREKDVMIRQKVSKK